MYVCMFPTEALEVTDPAICYILDAFLLLYGIVFTALYFREKVRVHGRSITALTIM